MNFYEQKDGLRRVQQAIADFQQGKMVIMVDDEDRENEGDLVLAAEHITAEAVNFMTKHGRGLICLSLTPEKVDSLDLPQMAQRNTNPMKTGFTISIEAREGVSTGISAQDRAHTIRTAIQDGAAPSDLVTPGHIFPLRAKKGGVLVRAGHTEGSIDLARLAGLQSSAVICEVLKDDGSMARRDDLEVFAKEHDLTIVSIADIIHYRMVHESLIEMVAETKLPTRFGDFKIRVYENSVDDYQHIALIKGEIKSDKPTLVRVHSECLTGDMFSSLRCDCGPQLDSAMQHIAEAGEGVLLYIRQEGRGIGLINKIKAYNLQDTGLDTVEANEELGFHPDLRDYGIGAQVLADIGLHQIRLMTNNPKKIVGLDGYGLEVVDQVPVEIDPHDSNLRYLQTKKAKMGHLLKKV